MCIRTPYCHNQMTPCNANSNKIFGFLLWPVSVSMTLLTPAIHWTPAEARIDKYVNKTIPAGQWRSLKPDRKRWNAWNTTRLSVFSFGVNVHDMYMYSEDIECVSFKMSFKKTSTDRHVFLPDRSTPVSFDSALTEYHEKGTCVNEIVHVNT